MNFGNALAFLKSGARVAREGWNGKNMWIELANHGLGFSDSGRIDGYNLEPFIVMKTADDKYVPWQPSQTDVLALDWLVRE